MCWMAIGAIGSVVSGVMGAMGAKQQADAQAASLKAQAAFNQRQADAETLKGSTEIAMQRRNIERIQGGQAAGYGASGIASEGTVVDVAMATMAEGAMDRQAIRFGRDLASSNYNYQAQIDLMNAKQAKIQGQYGMLASLVTTGTRLASSFSGSNFFTA